MIEATFTPTANLAYLPLNYYMKKERIRDFLFLSTGVESNSILKYTATAMRGGSPFLKDYIPWFLKKYVITWLIEL